MKSRSRTETTKDDYVSIPNDDFDKIENACAAFGCVPYFAIVMDAGEMIRGFILPMSKLLTLFPRRKLASGWKMTPQYLECYEQTQRFRLSSFKRRRRSGGANRRGGGVFAFLGQTRLAGVMNGRNQSIDLSSHCVTGDLR